MYRSQFIERLEEVPQNASDEEFLEIVRRNKKIIKEALEHFPEDEDLLYLLGLTDGVAIRASRA